MEKNVKLKISLNKYLKHMYNNYREHAENIGGNPMSYSDYMNHENKETGKKYGDLLKEGYKTLVKQAKKKKLL